MKISGLERVGILRKVKLDKQVNSHSSCKIEMLYTGDNISELQRYIGTEITVEDDARRLMRGRIESITVNQSFSNSTVVFYVYSFSMEADKITYNRAFQDTKKNYSDIISCLKNDRVSFQIIERSLADEKKESIVFQHNCTDFEFAKKIASSKNFYLFIDDTSQKSSISICRSISGAKKQISDEQIVILDYCVTRYEEQYRITTRDYFDFGSVVTLNGYDYVIIGFSLFYEDHVEAYQYVLSRNMEEPQIKFQNDTLILGRCKIVNNDDPEHLGRIQVSFLEYEDSLPDNKLWIPYTNNMTEGDCGVAFVPDVEEFVSVYYCNSHCYASGCIRDKEFNSQLYDVSVRSVFTRNVKISISDENIDINAFDYKIQIDKDNAVVQRDKNKISISSNEILIRNDSSNILAENDVIKIISDKKTQLKSNEINIDGSSKVTIKTSALDIG